ncbi:hypothetical protein TS85_08400 [Sphingomonas hengshuiensis]|uniref:Alginate export domain-containing protein n=2 Tax=Sphingomonas hengshuiensis TaxID=1609977 RepID=A0A7U5HVK5_9SPHN|nr:hypothetical protein TS85_08400 [Sphingomonas hengshuiensis]
MLLGVPAARAQALPETVNWRYDEDWSGLRDRAQRPGAPWWLPAKYVPLDAAGRVTLTTGIDARVRYEGFTGNEWGSGAAPDDGYLWLRALPYADLHVGSLRAFVQPIAGYARGVRPISGPVDRTGVDLLQGFADLRLSLGSATLTVRGGRELVALGSERLVGARWGPNIPQAFDGLRAILDAGATRVQLLRLRPVQIGPGDFDDRTSTTKRLSGAYATTRLPIGSGDLYYLDAINRAAHFDQGSGREHRQSFGLRLFGAAGGLRWNWEAMVQRGRFAGAPIRAWSVASETGYRFAHAPLTPLVRLRANVVSGDRDPADRVLQTFDPLYPKGKYFGELSPLGPYNIVNLHPGVTFTLGHGVDLGLAAVRYWRESRGDGLYGVPGNLIRSGKGSRSRDIGEQAEVLIEWQANRALSFSASASLFRAGRFLRETGPARPIHMAAFETAYRF